ncbi:DUF4326 domain-containing protein [Mycolicibacterium senegalense]|uniref:DUF4326 domain-containing protein n=1 Tax=Mycolicibacterium senegalense TaxID=1796 RepID=UPI003AAEF6AF
MPERIQRKRTKGWKTPMCSCGCGTPARYVGRPGKWGNPFQVIETTPGHWSVIDENDVDYTEPPGGWTNKQRAMWKATGLYHNELVQWSEKHMMLPELRGHDLVCWCPLDSPCHADVLLHHANWDDAHA